MFDARAESEQASDEECGRKLCLAKMRKKRERQPVESQSERDETQGK